MVLHVLSCHAISGWILRLLLATVLLAAPATVLAEVKDTPDGKEWKVKCEQGVCPGTRIRLTVGPQKIIVTARGFTKDQDHVAFTIPLGGVVAFAHHTVEHGSAEGWNSLWNGMDPSTPQDAMGALVLLPVLAGVSAILEQVKQTDHRVVLHWRDAGGEKLLVMTVRKDEYGSLLTELHRVTGLEWRDLTEESRQVAQEIQQDQNKVRTTRVDFRRSANLPGRALRLPAGHYHLVLLEREAKLGELYFFSHPDTKPEHFVARSVVEIEDRIPAGDGEDVTYTDDGRTMTISEVQFDEKALKLVATPPAPPTPEVRRAEAAATKPDLAEILRSCRTLAVTSKTVWFKPSLLQEALQNSEGFRQSGLALTADEKQADVVVQVNRPLFTFDWTYTISHRESGTGVGQGKVTAWDEKTAAPKLARDVQTRLRSLGPAVQAPSQAQPETHGEAENPSTVH